MTTLDGRLRDPDYHNWVKSALCLQYTRDGLMTFTGLKSLELNQTIIQQLRLNGNPSVYNLCPTIAFDTRRKSITCCRNCNDILKEVMKYQQGRLDLNLRNSDPTQLLHQHWQCAKLYMNPGQDVISAGPEDTDISGLLNFIDNCTVPRSYVNNPDKIKQVRDTTNRVLHTSSMKIREDDFQNVITQLLLDLLEDAGFLLYDLDAKTSVEKIKKVKKTDFIITQDNEKKVLDTLTNEIRQMNKLTSDEINKLDGRLDKLNSDISALKCSNQKDLNDLQNDIKRNDTTVSKVTNMYEMLRTQVKQSKDLYDGMSQQLKDIQEQTKTTNESHKTLQLKLGDIEKRLSGMQEQIGNLGAEQTKLKDNQKEDRTHIGVIYKRQDLSKEQSELTLSEEEKSLDDLMDELEVAFLPLPQWEPFQVFEIITPSILICDEENKTHKKEEFRNLEKYDVKKNDTTVSKTLHAEDQRKAEQTANEVAILHVKGDSLRIGLVGHESFEQDHDISVRPFLSEDVMLKADKYTDAAKRNNFLIQNVVICPSAVGRENIMQIPELLKTGGLIPRLIIPYAIELALKKRNRKKAHELLLSVATYIKQADSDNIVDAWPAYKENKPWDPIFVVLTISNFQGEWEEILGFPVFKRRYDFVSSEAAIVVNSKTFSENLLDFSDFNKRKNVILSREVIEKHSNITIMNTCSFRSKSGGKEIFKEKCVVIHCLVKGLIPFQEEPFPRNISGISVDVREGYVTMGMKPGESGSQSVDVDSLSIEGAVSQDVDCETVDHVQSPKYKAEYHSMCEKMQNLDLVGPSVQMGTRSTDVNQNLLMGTTISRTGSIPLTGTLGGFVRLHGGDMGFVTCAHVVGLNKDQTVSQPSHAELPPSHRSPGTICGHVERAIFAPGGCDDTGIDAAVVRISKRQPTDGDFIWVSPESQSAAGFSSTLKFTSGKVLTRDEIMENRRADVIKVGSQSGLTRGSLYLTETFVRISNREMILPGGKTAEFYNQMEIQSHAGSKAFFELGDSGSLVFMVLNNNELHCIGLAIGKTSYSSCLVTPMCNVLDSLGLEDKDHLLQFGALHGPPSNGFHLPNGPL